MKKQRFVLGFLVLSLVLSLFLGIETVSASAYPTFSVSTVVKDTSITIVTKDMPANKNFQALMGEINTQGIGGIVVATFGSGEGGTFGAVLNIPAALKGRAQIAVRLVGTDNPYFAYNWFVNDPAGTWPVTPPVTPDPEVTTGAGIPTFSISEVLSGEDVSIRTANFPKNVEFTVLMGKMWTQAVGGIKVATLNSGEGGVFDATFDIPAALAGEERVAIRLEGVGGYFAYNWFWNKTATDTPPADPGTGYMYYPYFYITAVVRDSSVTIKGYNMPKNYDFKVLMGAMWTMGIGGMEVASFNSGEGGTFTATYNIPAALAGQERIAIRLQSSYYYAYNWFWNNTATVN